MKAFQVGHILGYEEGQQQQQRQAKMEIGGCWDQFNDFAEDINFVDSSVPLSPIIRYYPYTIKIHIIQRQPMQPDLNFVYLYQPVLPSCISQTHHR
jgi:hypothetical protein